jgi:hypothetical protein
MFVNKINDILRCYSLHRDGLHPLGKIVCDGQNKLVVFAEWRINFANHVHTPASEWPWFDDRVHY